MSEVQEASQVDFAQFVANAIAAEQPKAEAEEPKASVAAEPAPQEPVKEEQPKAETEEASTDAAATAEPEKDIIKEFRAKAAAEKEARTGKARERQEVARLQAELQKEREAMARYKAIEDKLKSDPLSALDEVGISYKKLSDAYLKKIDENPNAPDPEVVALAKRQEALEAKLREAEESLERSKRQEALQAFHSDVRKTVESRADDFEYLAIEGEDGIELVSQIVLEHFNATEQVMPTKDACELAEKYFSDRAQRYLRAKKSAKAQTTTQAAKPATPTLTATMREAVREADETISDEERMIRFVKQNSG